MPITFFYSDAAFSVNFPLHLLTPTLIIGPIFRVTYYFWGAGNHCELPSC